MILGENLEKNEKKDTDLTWFNRLSTLMITRKKTFTIYQIIVT